MPTPGWRRPSTRCPEPRRTSGSPSAERAGSATLSMWVGEVPGCPFATPRSVRTQRSRSSQAGGRGTRPCTAKAPRRSTRPTTRRGGTVTCRDELWSRGSGPFHLQEDVRAVHDDRSRDRVAGSDLQIDPDRRRRDDLVPRAVRGRAAVRCSRTRCRPAPGPSKVVANPPRPTQNAEYAEADADLPQFPFGCTQVAVTSENASGWSVASAPAIVAESLIAYPAQFEADRRVMSRMAAAAGSRPRQSTTCAPTRRAP